MGTQRPEDGRWAGCRVPGSPTSSSAYQPCDLGALQPLSLPQFPNPEEGAKQRRRTS